MKVRLIEGEDQGLGSSIDYVVEDRWPNGDISISNGEYDNHVFGIEDYVVTEYDCRHEIIKEDYCVTCGKKIYATEERHCSECLHFRTHNNCWYSCEKSKLTIWKDKHVYYKIAEGTCFRDREDNDVIKKILNSKYGLMGEKRVIIEGERS